MSDVPIHIVSKQSISITPSASQYLQSCLRLQGKQGIRLSVKKTGCSGYSYVLDYVDAPDPIDVIEPLENEYFLCIDKKSLPFLKGIKMDYVKQGINQKFVFENPNQTGQCGCGESFTIDSDMQDK